VDGEVSSGSLAFFRPWTTRELAQLRRIAQLGAQECTRRLGRTMWPVRTAASRHFISLRPPGERRGVVFAQPHGWHLPHEQREAILASPHHDKILTAHLNFAKGIGELCPGCGRWPISTEHGLCHACYAKRLANIAAQRAAEAEERLRRWRENSEAG